MERGIDYSEFGADYSALVEEISALSQYSSKEKGQQLQIQNGFRYLFRDVSQRNSAQVRLLFTVDDSTMPEILASIHEIFLLWQNYPVLGRKSGKKRGWPICVPSPDQVGVLLRKYGLVEGLPDKPHADGKIAQDLECSETSINIRRQMGLASVREAIIVRRPSFVEIFGRPRL